jgi:outer membrane biosynthesis protein TonB
VSRGDSGGLRTAVLISAVVHAGVAGGVWAVSSRGPELPPMRVYAVNIVSPPPQQLGETRPEPEPVAEPEAGPEVPEPEPEAPAPAPPPPPPPAPAQRPTPAPPPPRPAPPPEAPRQQQAQAEPRPQPSSGPRPEAGSPGGENLDLQLRGVQCPSPDYCNNIIRQINRYFRSPGGGGEADVFFVINRDGSVADLRLESSIGGAAFRLAVLEAVEQAGINRAFGPLPQPYQADQLPVSFYFRPAR